MKIKTGDNVIVKTGVDRGKQGKVIRVLKESGQVIVDGVNMKKKHHKPMMGGQGEIIEKAFPVNVSNVAVVDPKHGTATRIGFDYDKKGNKVRIAKKSGQQLAS